MKINDILYEVFDGLEKRERADQRADLKASGHGTSRDKTIALPPDVKAALDDFIKAEKKPKDFSSWKARKYDPATGIVDVVWRYRNGSTSYSDYKVNGSTVVLL